MVLRFPVGYFEFGQSQPELLAVGEPADVGHEILAGKQHPFGTGISSDLEQRIPVLEGGLGLAKLVVLFLAARAEDVELLPVEVFDSPDFARQRQVSLQVFVESPNGLVRIGVGVFSEDA